MIDPYPKSQWDLENDVVRLEQMIIVYEQEIEKLDKENKILLEEIQFLRMQLEYKTLGFPQEDGLNKKE